MIKDKLMKFKGYFFVPTCNVCKRRMPPETTRPICKYCSDILAKEKEQFCRICGRMLPLCLCESKPLEKAGCEVMRKLVYYQPKETDSVVSRIIYRLKRANSRRLVSFAAAEMSVLLEDFSRDSIITFAPRSPRAVALYGYDQGRSLAKALSKKCGLAYEDVFRRRRGKEQKTLDYAQRAKNAKKSTELSRSADVVGKKYIVIDDIATSGQSLAVCTELLYKGGAKSVSAAVFAWTKRGK